MTTAAPLVSVVIPTCDRPQLLLRAVQCALAQTLRDIEVIVVFDGSPSSVRGALDSLSDSRLRVLFLEQNQGAPAARTAGVEAARADWIASLDDDDEWDPLKLELQWQHARCSASPLPIVPCRFVARTDAGDHIWPRRWPRSGEPVSEYLFCSSSLTFGKGIVPSSVLLAPRELYRLELPYCTPACHDDLDWLLRATSHAGVALDPLPDPRPLAIWHREGRTRSRCRFDWRPSLEWVTAHPQLITPRARSAFLLRWTGNELSARRQWDSFWPILSAAVRLGQPSALDLLLYLANWLLPLSFRRALASWVGRARCPSASGEQHL